MRRCIPWTSHEEAILRDLWEGAERSVIEAALPRHTWNGLEGKANELRLWRDRPGKVACPQIVDDLRKLRRSRRLKQESLCRTIGVDRSLLARWERGTVNPGLVNFLKWIAALDCELIVRVRSEARPQ